MSENTLLVNANVSESNEDFQPSKKRWFLAFLLMINVFTFRLPMYSFGMVNNVFMEYFQLPYVAVDWFMIIQQPGIIAGFVGIGVFGYENNYGFRPLSIVAASISVVSNVLLQLSITFSKAYILTYASQFLNGICFALSKVMSTQLAKRWFPENQIGTALSFFTIASVTATTLSYTLPSYVLNVKYNYHNFTTDEFINTTSSNLAWHNIIKTRLYYFYSPLIAFIVIILVLFIAYSKNQPIISPSAAQVQMRTNESQIQIRKKSFIECVKIFCFEFKAIMFDKMVLQATLLETIRSSVSCSQGIFMGEILRKLVKESSGYTGANIATSYALLTYEASFLIGSIFSGIILDHYKKHVLQATIALIMVFVFKVFLTVSYFYKSLYAIYVLDSFLGFSSALAAVCIYDIAFCHLHPKDPGIINLSMGIVKYFGMAVIFQTTRIVLIFGGGLFVFIFQSFLLLFAILICKCINFKYAFHGQN